MSDSIRGTLESYGEKIGDKDFVRKVAYQAMRDAGFGISSSGFGAARDRFMLNLFVYRCDENGKHIKPIYGEIVDAGIWNVFHSTNNNVMDWEVRQILNQYKDDYLAELEREKKKSENMTTQ